MYDACLPACTLVHVVCQRLLAVPSSCAGRLEAMHPLLQARLLPLAAGGVQRYSSLVSTLEPCVYHCQGHAWCPAAAPPACTGVGGGSGHWRGFQIAIVSAHWPVLGAFLMQPLHGGMVPGAWGGKRAHYSAARGG